MSRSRLVTLVVITLVALTMMFPGAALADDPADMDANACGEFCEFPVQSSQPESGVPQPIDDHANAQDNVITYQEVMTRHMITTPWHAVSMAKFPGDGNVLSGDGNVRLANSPGLSGFAGYYSPYHLVPPLVG